MAQEKKTVAASQASSADEAQPDTGGTSAGSSSRAPSTAMAALSQPRPNSSLTSSFETDDAEGDDDFPLTPASGLNFGASSSASQQTLPPPIPGSASPSGRAIAPPPPPDLQGLANSGEGASRRAARRRPAGPPRTKIAANDDAPSIGGLIYALDQKPATTPFKYAAIASGVWTLISLGFTWAILRGEFEQGATLIGVLERPSTFLTAAAIFAPIAILWFLALLAWRSEELRLRSSTMTEVAIRLAEPDRMAEQSVASLGQAVRRQVSFMNDAISRALGRAGELEALVHNEVSALERSYEENERKIRGLIQELSGERSALLDTSERVTDTLRALGTDIPMLIENLSSQQMKLASIIQGAGDNLTSLEQAVGQSAIQLESTVDRSTHKLNTSLTERTDQMQVMLESYTSGLAMALGARTEQLQDAIAGYVQTLDTSLSSRTENLQAVFEEYGRALDTTLTTRAQALDAQLVERTRTLDEAFGARLQAFDEQIMRSTLAIDTAVSDKAQALTSALDSHARTFSETISRQALNLDESLMQGISSVRRTSENITRQSLKAIEGLAHQSDMLKNVSENLLAQVNSVTNRFENQGQMIMRAANSMESANYKLETTLQGRHADITSAIDRLSGKADEFGRAIEGYSSTIEGQLSDADQRARQTAEQLRIGAETTRRAALADLERLRAETGSESDRALDELRRRFSSISTVVDQELSSLSSRIDQTSDDVRQRATRAAAEIADEQQRLREQMDRLPQATRENAEVMRRALQDQLRAIEALSTLATKSGQSRDVTPPIGSPQQTGPQTLTGAYATEIVRGPADGGRSLSSLAPPPPAAAPPPQPMRAPEPQRPAAPMPQAALPRPNAPQPAPGDGRDNWSFGDLLARASREEDHHPAPQQANRPGLGLQSQLDVIARALDPVTATALWSRINSGQRGVMVRSIYSPDGRAAYDDLLVRYRMDADLRRTIDHYLSDFENLKREAELRDPTGRAAQAHLMSDMGRVYLFLAHVSGRIA